MKKLFVLEVSAARVIRATMVGLMFLTATIIGTSRAHAQDIGQVFAAVVGQVAGNVVGAGVDGVSCGAMAGINAKFRGNHGGYNQYQRQADYNACVAMQNMQRQQAYYQRMAMQQRAAQMAAQNAPRCQYWEQNGVQYRSCTETVYGQWRR